MLEIRLLGQFSVRQGSQPVEIASRPAQTLLAYLLLRSGVPQRREQLSGLLWPDASESNARSNLRHALWRLRQALETGAARQAHLLADNFTVAWDSASGYWLDTAVLQRGLAAGSIEALIESASVYKGELLPGFYADWVGLEREHCQTTFEQVSQALLDRLLVAQRWSDALRWAEHWIARGQAPEPAYRALMQAQAALGDQGALAAAFQRCLEALQRDLSVEPSQQTRALFEGLRRAAPAPAFGSDAVAPRAVILTAPGAPAGAANTLPAASTPFVGREGELGEVARRLADPACRLLTLIGPGGIGKTRLAVQAAAAGSGAFADGIHFAALAPISTVDLLPSTLVDALHFTVYGGADPAIQLLDYLRDRHLLLVLDNFEHLLEGAGFIATLLHNAPRLKLLVTSQERLNLQGEWLMEIGGMPFPAGDLANPPDLSAYDAVALFVACARRVDGGFDPTPADLAAILRICSLVEGMPLGIELAAAWVRAIPPVEIAREIERSLSFLTTTLRDVPLRHRSLQAVFDHSWGRLAENEQDTFSGLAVFAGGFDRLAAWQVLGAALEQLSALADKSLLRRTQSGRYEMHGLLRQFALDRLRLSGRIDQVRARHLEYFAGLAAEAEAGLRQPAQLEWLQRLEADHDNLRVALKWALDQKPVEGQRLAGDLARFWYLRGYWREGREWLAAMLARGPAGEAIAAATERERAARARALVGAGWLADENGSEGPLYEESLSLYRAIGDPWGAAFSLRGLGAKLSNEGELRQAAALLNESLQLFASLGDDWGQGLVHNNLGWVAFGHDDYDLAHTTWSAGLVFFRKSGDRWGIAVTLGGLTYLARLRDQYALSATLSEESLNLFRELGDKAGMAVSLTRLAQIAFRRSNYELAITLVNEGLALQQELGDKRGLVNSKSLLGLVRTYQGRYTEAQSLLDESYAIASEVWGEQNYPFLLNYLGLLPFMQGNLARAAEMWEMALTIHRDLEDQLGTGYGLYGLGMIALYRGELERAVEQLQFGLALFRKVNDRRYIGLALNALARAVFSHGDSAPAEALLMESLSLRKELGDRQGQAEALETRAAMSLAAGEADWAAQLFGAAEALRELIGAPLPPVEAADYQAAVDELRRIFFEAGQSEAALQAAWRVGRELAAGDIEALARGPATV